MIFDKIYCLHLAEAQERYESSKSEFAKVGILDQVDYWWTSYRHCLNSYIINNTPSSLCDDFYDMLREKYNKNVYVNVFNVALEHYTIVKQAYERGFEYIMVFEDDVKFSIDKEQFNLIENNLPNDFDLILFFNCYRHSFMEKHETNNEKLIKFEKYTINNNHPLFSAGWYALSRKGMKAYIDIHDKNGISISDQVWKQFDKNYLNVYEPICNLTEYDIEEDKYHSTIYKIKNGET